MNRRDLIKAFAVVAPLTVAGRVWAAPATDARLLVVFLRGAYDAANVVVPVSSDFYHNSRPTLGIAKPDAGNPSSALSLGADWGLTPACVIGQQLPDGRIHILGEYVCEDSGIVRFATDQR